MLASIESAISKTLIYNKISYEDITTINKKERNYRERTESIRMMKSQKSNIERNKLIEDGQRIIIHEIIK